jgi:hypothetical protein
VVGGDRSQAESQKDIPPMMQWPDQQSAKGERSRHPYRCPLVGWKPQKKGQPLEKKKGNREKQNPSEVAPEFPKKLGAIVVQSLPQGITGCHPENSA